MASDTVFFLKAYPDKSIQSLSWPDGTRLIAVDPPASCMCGGVDPRCSTAYSCLWNSTGSVAAFVARYGPPDPGRIAFAGFSAAHGLLNPMMRSEVDRRAVSALMLFDASFGGGKDGYEAAVRDAIAGKMLLVATTGQSGGDASWAPVWQAATGGQSVSATPPASLPVQPQTTLQAGNAYYLKFGADLPHPSTGKILPSVLDSYLIPWWKSGQSGLPSTGGNGSGSMIPAVLAFLAVVGAGFAVRSLARRNAR